MLASVINGAQDAGCEVVGVFRHEKVTSNPILLKLKDYIAPSNDFAYIKTKKLYDIKARSINSEAFRNEFLRLNADILLIASWSERLKKPTLILPKVACINAHPSLLPKYRGPNPYLQVIKNQETETGVTFHLMDENYDTGAILAQAKVPVLPTDTGNVLKTRCALAARKLLAELLDELARDVVVPVEQNELEATYQPAITANDILIDFLRPATEIDAHLRAFCDWQSCFFKFRNIFFKVNDFRLGEIYEKPAVAGTIVEKTKYGFGVVCADGRIIHFENLRVYANFSKLKTFLYIKNFIKEGDIVC